MKSGRESPLLRDAVRWAPLVGRPPDYLPSGTVGQWLPAPCNGGTSKRAATLEPTKRRKGRLGPRAGHPKRTRPNCHAKRYSRTSVGSISAGQGPWRRGATGYCRLSRQPLVRHGRTVACVSLFVSFDVLVSLGPIFEVFLTDPERCAKAGSLSLSLSLSLKSRVFTPHCATLSGIGVLRCRAARDTKPPVFPYPSVGYFTCGSRTFAVCRGLFRFSISLKFCVFASHG